MNNLTLPVEGSAVYSIPGFNSGLSTGIYLDEDVALKIDSTKIIVVAPTLEQAKRILANLSLTAWSWQAFKVKEELLNEDNSDLKVWLDFFQDLEAGER